jgi:serum/glucocorticoid-regulated kinase 2
LPAQPGKQALSLIVAPYSNPFIMLKSLGIRKKGSSATLSPPSPPPPASLPPMSRTGLLTIRVLWADGLSLPTGTAVPPVVQAALASQQAKVAAAVSPSSVNEQRHLHKRQSKRGDRDSVQRAQCWWLPYLVMEFDVNQVLITSLGGDIAKPLYMYQAHL